MAMPILDSTWEVVKSIIKDDRSVNVRHMSVFKLMFDSDNNCGIINVPDNYAARTLRDLLIPHLTLQVSDSSLLIHCLSAHCISCVSQVRLRLVVKDDLIHPVVSALAPRVYGAFKTEAFVGGLKAMNKFLDEGWFELIKVMDSNYPPFSHHPGSSNLI